MKTDKERLAECLSCEFFETCFDTVTNPEEYEDGSCKTKDVFKKRCEKPEVEENA